jgi:FKBP-type peptidyl-prolyl cis-trans isomerase FklB
MKNLVIVALLLTLGGLPVAAQEQAQAFANQKDKTSYAIGADIGNSFKRRGLDLNPELVLKGLRDALGTAPTLLSEKEIRDTIVAYQTELQAKMQETLKAQGEKNQKEGTTFLATNKTKQGVVTLPSGLQYKVITAGTGPKPTANDSVKCHYRGTFIDGSEFDSSYSRNQPAVFPVRGVIGGWTEALQLMPVGSKWQLVVPYELAYGAGGNPPRIAPYATLVFEIELLGIEPPAEPSQPKPAAPSQR